jgi:two-component system, NtrC family, response regulator PilR
VIDKAASENTAGIASDDFAKTASRFVRCSLMALALLSATFYSLYAQDNTDLLSPSLLLASYTAICAYWLTRHAADVHRVILQGLIDSIYVSILIYLTGGLASPFSFLYIAIAIGVALLANPIAAAGVGLFSYFSFIFLSICFRMGVFSLPSFAVGISVSGLLAQQAILAAVLVLAIFATTRAKEGLLNVIAALSRSQSSMAEIQARQGALVETLEDGVLSTDLAHQITTANEKAKRLLGFGETSEIQNFQELLKKKGIPAKHFELSGEAQAEVLLPDGQPHTLKVTRKLIVRPDGSESGYVYLIKDVTVLKSLEEQLQFQRHIAELKALRNTQQLTERPAALQHLIGESAVMKKAITLVQRVAPAQASVLIIGESGTGKEVVARAIHALSDKSNSPFVAVNCGAIPENLIESELFGHVKGAFTGAESNRKGLFAEADGGTLFLDEIGELPIAMQAKLLRALQERLIRPVGGNQEIKIDVRIVSATNRQLKEDIKLNKFREDLYYRLNVVGINLPALRERKDDIPLLITRMLQRYRKPDGSEPILLPATMQSLMGYSFPGNVRELENIIERAVVLGGDVLLPEHLPDSVIGTGRGDSSSSHPSGGSGNLDELIDTTKTASLPVDLDLLLNTIEKRFVDAALEQSGGAKTKAAELLGINLRSLRYRLNKHS